MTTPLVIAHRGASGYEVENSVAAFRAAVRMGADGVELDVHATADGVLIVHHDATIGTESIPQLTCSQVRAFRLANGEWPPTLAETLDALGARLQAFIEVKSLDPRFDERLFATIDAGPNPSGYAVHSFDHRIIRRLGDKRPGLPRGVLSSSYVLNPLTALEDTGATMLWQERSLVDRPLAEMVHGAGYRVFVWTVNQADEMRRLLSFGADAVCTNFPDVGRKVVNSFAA